MLDSVGGLFELISSLLNFFYELIPNYAVAIALLTITVMVITTPLTMKSTRSMIEMQRLQPEIRRLQQQYKDDRQKLNEEMMRFYKEHQINPLGGCLPILIQAPVFSILFWVVRGLTNSANFIGMQRELGEFGIDPTITEGFKPKYLDQSAQLYQDLLGQEQMLAFGVDLAISPSEALQEGFLTALPYVLLVLIIGGLSWLQQKQIMGRNKGAEVSPQQKMMMRIGPAMFVFFAFVMPAALGVYFLVSTVWRVGQQGYITRALYKGDDSVGAQAQKAMAEARAAKEKEKGSGKGGSKASANSPAKKRAGGNGGAKKQTGQASGNGSADAKTGETPAAGAAASSASKAKQHPRSRKKKKRK